MASLARATHPPSLVDPFELVCRHVLKWAQEKWAQRQGMLAQQAELQSMIDQKNRKLQREKQRSDLLLAKLRRCDLATLEMATELAEAGIFPAPRTQEQERPDFFLKVHYSKKPVIMDDKRGVVFETCEPSAMSKNSMKREVRAAKMARWLVEEAARALPKADTTKEDVCEAAPRVSTTPSSSRSPSGSPGGPPSKRLRTSWAREGHAMQDGDGVDGCSTTRSNSEPSSGSRSK